MVRNINDKTTCQMHSNLNLWDLQNSNDLYQAVSPRDIKRRSNVSYNELLELGLKNQRKVCGKELRSSLKCT